jgi:Cu+-exporting ATPase
MQVAATLEQGSEHPLAKAVMERAAAMNIRPQTMSDFSAITGSGITARVDGAEYILGSPRFLREGGAQVDESIADLQAEGKTVVGVAIVSAGAPEVLGYLAIADRLRGTSAQAVKRLQSMGIEVVMLTGDNAATASAIALQAGITAYRAEVPPQDKAAEVGKMKAEGKFTGMVGDGINDAPALARADVSIALADGSATAQQRADLIVQSSRLADIAYAFTVTRRAMRLAHQNLGLALGCNMSFIALAALGITSPAIAVAGTAGSALLVLANAARLLRSDDIRQGGVKRTRIGRLSLRGIA